MGLIDDNIVGDLTVTQVAAAIEDFAFHELAVAIAVVAHRINPVSDIKHVGCEKVALVVHLKGGEQSAGAVWTRIKFYGCFLIRASNCTCHGEPAFARPGSVMEFIQLCPV